MYTYAFEVYTYTHTAIYIHAYLYVYIHAYHETFWNTSIDGCVLTYAHTTPLFTQSCHRMPLICLSACMYAGKYIHIRVYTFMLFVVCMYVCK